jgi:hypothetical protein
MEEWRALALKLCRHRGWSEHWTHRLSAHVLESSEFIEALRGKEGDPVEEAGDLLFTALAMIPERISLADVFERNQAKVAAMFSKPPYAGEEREPVNAAPPSEEATKLERCGWFGRDSLCAPGCAGHRCEALAPCKEHSRASSETGEKGADTEGGKA